MLSFFPLDVLEETWDVIESVSERFLTYSCLAERNHFSNFVRGLPKEDFCEIILKSGH